MPIEEKTINLEETSALKQQENDKGEQRIEGKGEEKKVLPAWRTIEILTDGNSIKVPRAEVVGRLEMLSVLRELIKVYEN